MNSYVVSFVMAGGRGSRLKILTKNRSKSAVTILGHYRIFDFVATNVENSGIPVMIVATQFEPGTLSIHIGSGQAWGFNGSDRRLEIVHPHEQGRTLITFEGTADSVRKNLDRIGRYKPHIVLVLGGDHIYYMNYEPAILWHEKNRADITIMANPVHESQVKNLGIMRIDENGRILEFAEKPQNKDVIESFRLTQKAKEFLNIDDPKLDFLASMGNYIFYWDRLVRFLSFPGVDFGKEIIPAAMEDGANLYAYVFNGYWRDVGVIRDYFNCNMDFLRGDPPLNLIREQIRTNQRYLPSAQILSNTIIQNAILSPGDIIRKGSKIKNTVLGYQCTIEENCYLDHCILLGASKNEFFNNQIRREYTTRIGRGSIIRYAILDKNVWIGENVVIDPRNGTIEERQKKLEALGLKPYRELEDGTIEGDFCIDRETGILVIGKQNEADPKIPILHDKVVV